MPENFGNANQIIQGLLGLIILILSGLISWMLVTVNSQQTKIALMQQTINTMNESNGSDSTQDSQLSKHWKIVGFHKDQINTLRVQQGLPMVSWPPLD